MKQNGNSEPARAFTDPPVFRFGSHRLSEKDPVFIVAEAGTSHGGDILRWRELIDAAAESGADSVKFQWVIADEIVHPKAGTIRLHGRDVRIWERFRHVEKPFSFYADLKEYCNKKNITFLCSPFGGESAKLLMELGVDAIKIASPELNHYPLLKRVHGIPLFLSTGVSELSDIEKALDFVRTPEGYKENGSTDRPPEPALLHCITSYPAPEDEYNLKLLPLLSQLFHVLVGVSDHSRHPLMVPVTAIAKGARVIEKHITLSRTDEGLDDPIALEPDEFGEMCRSVREMEFQAPEMILNECRRLFGMEQVERILGSGQKKLAPVEREFYGTTNRSIIALKDLEIGDVLSEGNIALLRSEQQRKPGLSPLYWKEVLGAGLQRRVKAAEGIRWEHLLSSPPSTQ